LQHDVALVADDLDAGLGLRALLVYGLRGHPLYRIHAQGARHALHSGEFASSSPSLMLWR